MPYIENSMTRRADEKPLNLVSVFFQHRMKSICVSACRADLELVVDLNFLYRIVHGKIPDYSSAGITSMPLLSKNFRVLLHTGADVFKATLAVGRTC